MKAKERYEKAVRELLGLSKPEKLFVSHFANIGSIKGAIEKIAAIRLQDIEDLLKDQYLHWENRKLLEDELFVTFREFKNSIKSRDSPIYQKYDPNITHYLKHLKNRVPKFHEFFSERMRVAIPASDLEKHVYITGGTGSGKSELINEMVGSLAYHVPGLVRTCSIVVIDPHGDLVTRFLEDHFCDEEEMERLKDRLVLIDPFLKEGFTPTINPFDIRDKSEKSINFATQELVNVFKALLRGDLTLQMEALLAPCIATLLRMGGQSLVDLQSFMNKNTNKHLIKCGLNSPNPAHRNFFENQFDWSNYEITKRSLATKIQTLLNFSSFSNLIIGKNTLDLEKALDSKKIVLFSLAKGNLGEIASEAYGRFIIAMMQGLAFKRVSIAPEKRVPVFLFIDECQNYVSPTMEDILTESRKYGLHLVLAQQRAGQGMSPKLIGDVLANTQVKYTGRNDDKTRSIITRETSLSREELQGVKEHEFYVSIKGRPSFKTVSNPYHVKFALGMSSPPENLAAIREDQLGKYYKPIEGESFTAPTTTEEVKKEKELKPKYPKPDW